MAACVLPCSAEARADFVPREAPYSARVASRPALARGAIRRSFVSIRRVVEVRLDRGFCATEPTRDVSDREALLVAVVARECDRPTALLDAVQSHHASDHTAHRRRQKDLLLPLSEVGHVKRSWAPTSFFCGPRAYGVEPNQSRISSPALPTRPWEELRSGLAAIPSERRLARRLVFRAKEGPSNPGAHARRRAKAGQRRTAGSGQRGSLISAFWVDR